MQENIAKIISLKRDYYTEGNHIQRLFDILNENMSIQWSMEVEQDYRMKCNNDYQKVYFK